MLKSPTPKRRRARGDGSNESKLPVVGAVSKMKDVLGPVLIAFILLNASSCFGSLLQGLFIFNLSDGIPLASPLLFAVDLCLQMFLSMLQTVCGTMLWKMRASQDDPVLLAGVKRAGVVVVMVQLVVFGMFGAGSEVVLFRLGYEAVLGAFALVLGVVLLRVWREDVLSHRAAMLEAALKFDFVALLMLACYGSLHLLQLWDAQSSGSMQFLRAVRANQWILLVCGACALILMHVMGLWATCKETTARGRKNPVQPTALRKLAWWNVVCAGLGLFGAPVVMPCLVASVLAASTIEAEGMSTGPDGEKPDIFYVARGDRFDLEY